MMSTTRLVVIVLLACCSPLQAGEWMFRLRDAHVQLRKALFDRDADHAWEQVDRETRQQAGILAARIRESFDSLPGDKQESLQFALGTRVENVRLIQSKDILVADFFLDAHPYLLVGNRDDSKLRDHGTRMAGPTAIVVQKNTPDETRVPYTFTVEGHFGGQAMDYRARLDIPSLDHVLGEAPQLPTLSSEEAADRAVVVFEQAQQSLAHKDWGTFWSLLDCDSQSQASHFADQARERARNPAQKPAILEMLSLREDELASLDGRHVWDLPWAREELQVLLNATDPTFVDATKYDLDRIIVPEGYRWRGKPQPENTIEFQSAGRVWQIPVRVNYRDGTPEIKLVLRPPFYLRLRKPTTVTEN